MSDFAGFDNFEEEDPWENGRIYSNNIPPKKVSPKKKSLSSRAKKFIGMKPPASPGSFETPNFNPNFGNMTMGVNNISKGKSKAPQAEDDFLEMLKIMAAKKGVIGTGGISRFLDDELRKAAYANQKIDNRIVLFYGFNGMLAQHYSIIKDMTNMEINARMAFAGNKVPWKVERLEEFRRAIDMFKGTPNALKLIEFSDALNIIRTGIDLTDGGPEFEDGEEDEFDDNCLDTCKPGDHKCGK